MTNRCKVFTAYGAYGNANALATLKSFLARYPNAWNSLPGCCKIYALTGVFGVVRYG